MVYIDFHMKVMYEMVEDMGIGRNKAHDIIIIRIGRSLTHENKKKRIKK